MAAGKLHFKSDAGGITSVSRESGATNGELVLPVSGTVASVASAVTDNAIARYDSTTGKLQNSGVIIDDSGNVGIGTNSPNSYAGYTTVTQNGTAAVEYDFKVNNSLVGYIEANPIVFKLSAEGNKYFQFTTNGSERVRIDSAGNVGIGVTPSAWASNYKSLGIEYYGNVSSTQIDASINLSSNTYYNGSNWIYKETGVPPTLYKGTSTGYKWLTAASGTAGNAITWTNAMTLDASGHLLVGESSGYHHILAKDATPNVGNVIFQIYEKTGKIPSLICYAISQALYSSTNSAIKVGRDATTQRSINAGGTINAFGADYAEYEYSNDITLTKGQIVGFKADGTLTDKYNESVRFAIKSTNPSIVGGDVWGIEEIVGKRPEQPVRKVDKTEQVQIEESEEFETVVIEEGDTDAEWEAIEAKYKADLAYFEARLEAERQKVDRIAYAGKVPVNVYGATAGQYIVAIEKDGAIDGIAVNKADMTFAQYQDAVGRVNKILDDGRAEVAVIIH